MPIPPKRKHLRWNKVIKTQADVDEFIESIRTELTTMIDNGESIIML